MPTHADPAAEPVPAQRVRALCPRCGYDLSGVVESWTESCPLEGVCSECGLGVVWGRVLRAGSCPHWSCEHVVVLTAWRVFKTGLRALLPWKLWRKLTLENDVVPQRLRAMLIRGVLTGYGVGLLAWLASVMASWLIFAWVRPAAPFGSPAVWFVAKGSLSWPIEAGWNCSGEAWAFLSWTLLCIAGIGVALPWSLMLVPKTLSGARIRRDHLLRGSGFACLGHIVLLFIFAVLSMAAGPATIAAYHLGWTGGYRALAFFLHPFARLGLHTALTLGAWTAFVVVYLRLRHAWSTVLLLGALTTLAMLMIWFVPTALGIVQVWKWG